MARTLASTVAAAALAALVLGAPSGANAQALATYGVIAGSAITNTDTVLNPTIINGNVGLSPGTSITGFSVGTVLPPYQVHQTDAVAAQAQVDLTTLYNFLSARPATSNLSGQDLGGMNLTAGVYQFDSSAQLTGTLTLNGAGNPNSTFVFIIGSTLTTASASSIVLTGGALGGNVFFVVGSSATLDTTTSFTGSILALTSITLNTDAIINCGAALARNGAVTLDTNDISVPDATCSVALAPGTFGTTLGPTATENAAAVAAALDAFLLAGGTLPLSFQFLSTLSPADLAIALSQLSGEAATGFAPAGAQSMNSFLSAINPRFAPDQAEELPGDAVRALGYAAEEPATTPGAPLASFDRTPVGTIPDPGRWNIWAAAYGGQNDISGNVAVGSHDRSSRTFGFAGGFDRGVASRTRVGLAIGAGGTNFNLAGDFGSGRSDMLHAAVYARTNIDPAYLAATLAYGWHGVTTSRYVAVAGDTFTAAYSAQSVAGQLEGGYRLRWATPYATLRGQVLYTPAYGETAASGASLFPLSYEAHTTYTLRSELGARFEKEIALKSNVSLALRAGIAWAHDFWSDSSMTATFQSLPGSTFTVQGADPAADSLLLSADAEFRFKNGFSVASLFNGEFAPGSQTWTGTGRVSYAW